MADHTTPIQILNEVPQAVEFAVNTRKGSIHQFGRRPHLLQGSWSEECTAIYSDLVSGKIIGRAEHSEIGRQVVLPHSAIILKYPVEQRVTRRATLNDFAAIHYASRLHSGRSKNALLHELSVSPTGYLFDDH